MLAELDRRGIDHSRDDLFLFVAAAFPIEKSASELADIWQAARKASVNVEGLFPTRGEVLQYGGLTGAFVRSFVPDGSGGLNVPRGRMLFDNAAVPEPASLAIWGGLGIVGLAVGWRRSRTQLAC